MSHNPAPILPEEIKSSVYRSVAVLNRCAQYVDEHGITTYQSKDGDLSFIEPLLRANMEEVGMLYSSADRIVKLTPEAVQMLKPFGLYEALSERDMTELKETMMDSQAEMRGSGWSARAGIGARAQQPQSWCAEEVQRQSTSRVRHSER